MNEPETWVITLACLIVGFMLGRMLLSSRGKRQLLARLHDARQAQEALYARAQHHELMHEVWKSAYLKAQKEGGDMAKGKAVLVRMHPELKARLDALCAGEHGALQRFCLQAILHEIERVEKGERLWKQNSTTT